jgi:hypothetical protein
MKLTRSSTLRPVTITAQFSTSKGGVTAPLSGVFHVPSFKKSHKIHPLYKGAIDAAVSVLAVKSGVDAAKRPVIMSVSH